MTYRVEFTTRAARDLERLFKDIDAANAAQARSWFNGLYAAALTLADHPARCALTPENDALRHLLYGGKPNVYRVIFKIDEEREMVTVIHIRHGARRPMKSRHTT